MTNPRADRSTSTQQIQQELKEQPLEENQIDFVQLPAETIAKLKHALKDEKKDIVRYSKLYLKEKFNIEIKRGGIVRVKNDRNSFDLYMVCPGTTLGEGGYGKVKLMRNIENPRDAFTLKVLNAEHSKNPDVEHQFREESEHLEALGRGKAVIIEKERALSEKEKPKKLYLMQQFFPGKDLSFYLKNRKPELNELVDITLQAIKCVKELHEKKRIHRDIKIENFIYHPNSKKLTIIDFGKMQKTGTKRVPGRKASGTQGYIASEIFSGENYTEKSDTYSLGKSIKNMLWICRESLHKNPTIIEIEAEKKLKEIAEEMSKFNPDERIDLNAAIKKLEPQKKELDRYASLNEQDKAIAIEQAQMNTKIKAHIKMMAKTNRRKELKRELKDQKDHIIDQQKKELGKFLHKQIEKNKKEIAEINKHRQQFKEVKWDSVESEKLTKNQCEAIKLNCVEKALYDINQYADNKIKLQDLIQHLDVIKTQAKDLPHHGAFSQVTGAPSGTTLTLDRCITSFQALSHSLSHKTQGPRKK